MFNLNLYARHSKLPEKLKFHVDDSQGISLMAATLADYISAAGSSRKIVALCIGTDRSTGDCLGPLVGSQLLERACCGLDVYGSLEKPVHASNLQQTLSEVSNVYQNPFIVAVDACLGKLDSVGYISLSKGALKPGAGVQKELPMVGEAHLTGIVNVGGFMEYLVLQNTRLGVVMNMAKSISSVLVNAVYLVRDPYSLSK